MKTFTKVILILSGVFATIGVICTVAAFAMGLTTEHFVELIQNGSFSFDAGDFHISLGGEIFNSELEDGETSNYEIEESCHSMEIEFAAGVLEISYGDVEEIQVNYNNIPNLKIDTDNGTLVIRDESKVNINLNNGANRTLEVVIPKDTYFEAVDIAIGASKATISNICAKDFELEVGAGLAVVKNLSAQKLDIETGLGEVDIEIAGAEGDYNYDVDCGIGEIVVGNYSWEGIGAQKVVNNGADSHMKIVCGVGKVNIHFTHDEETTCENVSHSHNKHNHY